MEDIVNSQPNCQQSRCLDKQNDIKMEYNEMQYQGSYAEISVKAEPICTFHSKKNEEMSRCIERDRNEQKEEKHENNIVKVEKNVISMPEHELEGTCEEEQIYNHSLLQEKAKKCYVNCQHKCLYCSAEFMNISHLIKHLKSHTRPKNRKSDKLPVEVEDLQVATKKVKGSTNYECGDLGSDGNVKVKIEIDMETEELRSGPEIRETGINVQDRSYQDSEREGHNSDFVLSNQTSNAKKQNDSCDKKCNISKNQQRLLETMHGEGLSTGTIDDGNVNRSPHPKVLISTASESIPSSICSSTEFSLTNYIQKPCIGCGEVLSLPDQHHCHSMTSDVTLEQKTENICKSSFNVCEHSFSQKDALERHQSTQCKEHDSKDIPSRYKCGICDEVWSSFVQYENHVFTRHATKCDGPSGVCFECNICGKICLKRGNFKKHLNTHIKGKRKKQSFTEIKIDSVDDDVSSMTEVHTNSSSDTEFAVESNDNSCKCDICGDIVSSEEQLKSHLITQHGTITNDKPGVFKGTCNVCGTTCSRKDSLLRHFLTHTNRKKSFKCTTCRKGYFSKRDLVHHQKIHKCVNEYEMQLTHFRNHQDLNEDNPGYKKLSKSGEMTPTSKAPDNKLDDLNPTDNTSIHVKYSRTDKKQIGETNNTDLTMEIQNQKPSNEIKTVHLNCGICDEVWNDNIQFENHIFTKHATKCDGQSGACFKCNICGKICLKGNNFKSHLNSHIDKEKKQFKCEIFLKARHEQIHAGMCDYSCDICGKQFRDKRSIESHMGNHLPDADKISGKTFENVAELESCDLQKKIGLWSEGMDESGNTNVELFEGEQVLKNDDNQQIESKTGDVKQSFTENMTDSMDNGVPSMTEVLTNSSSDTELAVESNDNSCKCDICGDIVSSEEQLKSHLITQHGTITNDKPGVFKCTCNVCGTTCSRKDSLLRHFLTHTNKKKSFTELAVESNVTVSCNDNSCKCDICGDIVSSMDQLKNHLITRHGTVTNDEQPGFTCNVCGTTCSRKDSLLRHLLTHTNRNRSFKCMACGKGYFTNRDLVHHQNIHNGVNECLLEKKSRDFRNHRDENRDTSRNKKMFKSGKMTPASKASDNELDDLNPTYDTTIPVKYSLTDKKKNGETNNTDFTMEIQKQKPSHEIKTVHYKCGLCGEVWNDNIQCENHIFTKHATECDGPSGVCFKCIVCGKICSKRSNFKSHLDSHIDKEKRTFGSCAVQIQIGCSSENIDESGDANQEIFEGGKILKHDSNQQVESNTGEEKIFTENMIDSIDNPGLSVTEVHSNSSSDTEVALESNVTVSCNNKKSCRCDICGDIVLSEEQLRNHFVTQHGTITNDKPGFFKSTCNICGTTCSRRCALVNHLLTHTNRKKTFKCTACGKAYFTKCDLACHEKVHNDMYKCDICGKKYRTATNLHQHNVIVHMNETSYKCADCGKLCVSMEALRLHRHVHGEKVYRKCNVCDKMVNTRNYRRHQQIHDNAHNPALKCNFCEKQLCDFRALKKHKALHVGEYAFICDICGEGFINESTHRRHMAKHTGERPFVCDICGAKFYLEKDLTMHVRNSHREKMIHSCPCDGCGRSFINKFNLQQHIKIHTENANYKCSICTKRFRTESARNKHLLNHRPTKTTAKKFKCDKCRKRFTSAENMKKHKENIHGTSKWKCHKCKKRYTTKGRLDVHVCVHEQLRYLCEFCGARYYAIREFQMHVGNHKCEVVKKPHKCTTCNAAFLHIGKLIIHERSHTGERPFVCDVCGKGFKSNGQRLGHMKLHARERSYKCEECDYRSYTERGLKDHSLKHTGEKPHICQLCGDRFRHSGTLHKHMRLVHKKKKKKIIILGVNAISV